MSDNSFPTKYTGLDGHDVFGILIPGFVFCCFLIITWRYSEGENLVKIYTNYLADKELYRIITTICLILIVSYVAGHIIGSFSVLFLEKIFIQKIYGYPYIAILYPNDPITDPIHERSNFYKTVSILLLIFMAFYDLRYLKTEFIGITPRSIARVAFWLCFSLCLLRFVSKQFNNSYNHLNIIRKKSILLLGVTAEIYNRTLDLFVIRQYIPLNNSLDSNSIISFNKKFQEIFQITPQKQIGTENYWAVYLFLFNNDPIYRTKASKLISQITFSRNMSFAFLLSSLLLGFATHYTKNTGVHLAYNAFFLLIFSFVMSLRYYYFYWLFSKYTFRTFIYINKPTA